MPATWRLICLFDVHLSLSLSCPPLFGRPSSPAGTTYPATNWLQSDKKFPMLV